MYRIAIAEDNRTYLAAFRAKVSECPELSLVFAASNGRQCMEQLKGAPDGALPQVIFMDLEMPEMDGVETIRAIASLYPELYCVALTVLDDEDKVFEAIQAGAAGYLLKHEPSQVLFHAVTDVLEYMGAPMSPGIARKALQLLGRSRLPAAPQFSATLPKAITEREEEILKHMVAGWDAKRIAASFDISVHTVRNHIANIYQKLQVQSKAQIMQMAHTQNWFDGR